jgi:hypothetical protein
MVDSKWNINAQENVLILPSDVTVSQIVELPAHAPWGAFHHAAYSADIEKKLKSAKRAIDDAINNAPGEPHEVGEAAAAAVKSHLENASRMLLQDILSGKFGGKVLGK